MTAAQSSLAFGGPHRLPAYAAAFAAGLLVAIAGLAISARPITEPAPLAIAPAAQAPVATITGADQLNAYMQSLLDRHAQAVASADPYWTLTYAEGERHYIQPSQRGSELYLLAQRQRAAGLPRHRLGGPHRD